MSFSHKIIECSCPEYEQTLEQKSYDRISNLPTDILYHILSPLDFTEVAKTASLSRKWRFIRNSMPCLNFNFEYFCNQEYCLDLSRDKCLSKFWAFVKWTFTMKDTTPIHKLQFLCDYVDGYQLDLLISLCAISNVQELKLMAEYGNQWCPLKDMESNVHVVAFSKNIYSLVKEQSFKVFGNLKTLHLVEVLFPDAYITEKLFSNCGVLENLYMGYCCFLKSKFLNISANKLRKLNFVNMGPKWCGCIFEGELKLHTPNLVSFSYDGPVLRLREFTDMLYLKRASILVYCPSKVLFPEEGALELGIHHVEALSASADFVLYFSPTPGRPGGNRNFSQFGCLRFLNLALQSTAHHIEGLLNLLQLSPNLEDLHINFCQIWISGWKARQMDVGFLSHNLKEIEIVVNHDSPDTLELVKFFLQNAKLLERIKFTQKYKKANQDRFYALQEVQLASKEVTVSVTSISASGKSELFEFTYGKCGASVQTKTSKMKLRIRSMRIAGKTSGGSS